MEAEVSTDKINKSVTLKKKKKMGVGLCDVSHLLWVM